MERFKMEQLKKLLLLSCLLITTAAQAGLASLPAVALSKFNSLSTTFSSNQETTDTQIKVDLIESALSQFSYYGTRFSNDPKTFFTTAPESTITSFLQKCPKAFYGLLYRTQSTEAYNELFDVWAQAAESDSITIPSLEHLKAKKADKPTHFFSSSNYRHYYAQACLKEQELSSSYHFFYHGQQAFFGFEQEFTSDLIQALYEVGLLQNSLPQDFFFIQNPDWMNHLIDNTAPNNFLQTEKNEQLKLMQGRTFSTGQRRDLRRLATNTFLFGNSGRTYSCTWHYVLNNFNIRQVNLNRAHECFKKLSLGYYSYNQYKNEIDQLEKEYNELFTQGRLLQIAIPKHLVNNTVYLSSDAAYKDPVYTKAGKRVTTVKEFFKHFYAGDETVLQVHAPQSSYRPGVYEVEFTVPLTADIVLNPHSGVKVFAYNCPPKNPATIHTGSYQSYTITYEEHKNKRAALCKKIVHNAHSNGDYNV